MNYCSYCGDKIGSYKNYCANCGANLNKYNSIGEKINIILKDTPFKESVEKEVKQYQFMDYIKNIGKSRPKLIGIGLIIALVLFLSSYYSDENRAIRAAERSLELSYKSKVEIWNSTAKLKKREDSEIGEEGQYEITGLIRVYNKIYGETVYRYTKDVYFLDGVFRPERYENSVEVSEDEY